MGLYWPDHSWFFPLVFFLLLFWDGFIISFNGINLLRRAVKLDGLSAFVVAAGAGFLVFKWPLHGVIFGSVLN